MGAGRDVVAGLVAKQSVVVGAGLEGAAGLVPDVGASLVVIGIILSIPCLVANGSRGGCGSIIVACGEAYCDIVATSDIPEKGLIADGYI